MRNKLCSFLGVLALLSPLHAQAALEVKTERLGHGVKAWYAESHTVPVVDILISFDGAGYASDPAGKEGRAQLAALMLTQGAGDMDALSFQRALDDGAIQLNTQVNADRLIIHLHALHDQTKRGGALLAKALSAPLLAADDLTRMKTALLGQLSQLQESPDYLADRLFNTKAFAGHPYANPPYGTPASVQALTADDLRQYVTTYLTRENMKIAVAGDVDGSFIDDALSKTVDALPSGDGVTIAPVTLQGGGTTVRQNMNVPQTVVAFAAPGIARDNPKFYAAYVLNHILGGNGLVSRLADGVRQQKGLAYNIGTDLDVMSGVSLLRGALATKNASAEEALNEVKSVLSQLREKGVTSDECKDAKTYIIGSSALRLDGSDDISRMILNMQIYRLGEDYLEKREGYFKSVSCSDVNAMARDLLDPNRFFFAIVGGTVEKPEAPLAH